MKINDKKILDLMTQMLVHKELHRKFIKYILNDKGKMVIDSFGDNCDCPDKVKNENN